MGEKPQMRHEKRWLLLILVSYAVLGIAYSWVVPLGEAPDEVDHFLYVRHLVEQHAFPVMQPVATDNDTMEANQPPLFYLLNAMVTAPFPMTASADLPLNACFTFDPHDGGRAHFYLHEPAERYPFAADYLAFRVARLVSVALGALTIGLAYGLGQQMRFAGRHLGLLAASILAFNPQFIFMTASVNNDVLTAVIGAALVYFSIATVQAPSLKRFVGLGALLGLGLLTKFALIAFWPLPLLAVLIRVENGRIKQAWQYGMVVIGLPTIIAGWWYVRASQLYGDPLAWGVHLQAKGSEVLRTSMLSLADLGDFVAIHFQSYWAWFGWLKVQTAGWVYGVLAAGMFVALIGLLLLLFDWFRQTRKTKFTGLFSFIHRSPGVTAVLFNGLAVAAIYTSLLRYIQTINWSGYQGRLAYAAAAPIAALLALGWWRFTVFLSRQTGRSWLTRVIGVLPTVGLLVLAMVSLMQLDHAFARPALYTPPAKWDRVCQLASDGFFIEAVEFPLVVGPGDSFMVSLGGYGEGDGTAVGEIALLDWRGSLLDTAVSNLSWSADEPVSVTVPLTVPPDILPMRARLVYFLNDEVTELGYLKIAAGETAIPVSPYPVRGNYADQIVLLGYDLQIEAGSLRLKTHWQALQPIAEDFTIFVHLLDENGDLIAQQDAQPQGGRYPTSIWDVGEVVVDEANFTFPPDAQPTQIGIGLYRLDTLGRLPVVGEIVGETAVSQTDQILLQLNR